MKLFYFLCYAVAAVLFAVAFFTPVAAVTTAGRPRTYSLIAAGLFVWVLADAVRQFDILVD